MISHVSASSYNWGVSMERKNYEDCEIEVILFDTEDVIVTSEATPTGDFETPVN